MATKAQGVRAQQEREAHGTRPKSPRRPRRDQPVDTAQPGVSATDRKAGKGATAMRNRSPRAGRKAVAVLEDSATDRPSRKSSRAGSKADLKAASPLTGRQKRRVHAPKTTATRAQAQTTRARAH